MAGLDVPEVVAEGTELVVTWAPPSERPIVEVAPTLAALLAAAHERGVCHGPLLPEHVRAGLVDGWAGGTPEDDVAAFGRLLLDAGPLPPSFEALARRAVADDPATRPTMHAVAEALTVPTPQTQASALRARRRFRRLRPAQPPVLRAREAADQPDRIEPEPAENLSLRAPAVRVPRWAPAVAALPIALVAVVVTEDGGGPHPAPPAAATAATTGSTASTSSTTSTTLGARPYEGVRRP